MKNFASRFAALIALSALAAPAAHAATVPDGGLLITRVNSEQWEITLVGGTTPTKFTGSVTSSVPFYSSSGANLESSDVVTQNSTSLLTMTLDVDSGRTDTARFSVAMNANLCLKGTGAPIYVGESLADATPVSAPVALHGVDACGSGVTTASATALTTSTSTAALTTSTRKFNKGHYIALMACCDSAKIMAASVKPGVKGFMKRYRWKELEPTQGNYDFSELQADLNWAAANGMQLVAMIGDKSFHSGDPENPAPPYLAKYTAANMGGGYTMIRWNPIVVTRFKALVTALGARFDSHRAFEGIATQETAPSLSGSALSANGYTPEKYRDAYIAMLTGAAAAMPNSRVFWFMNFMPGSNDYLASIAAAVASKGVVMGSPDVAPDNKALVTRTYPLYDQFYGRMPMFGQVEGLVYRHQHETSGYSTKYWTMTEIYNFAKNQMHANYMFWVRITVPNPQDSNDYFDALPVIAKYPFIN
jgi:opacity protein-like surface antigen